MENKIISNEKIYNNLKVKGFNESKLDIRLRYEKNENEFNYSFKDIVNILKRSTDDIWYFFNNIIQIPVPGGLIPYNFNYHNMKVLDILNSGFSVITRTGEHLSQSNSIRIYLLYRFLTESNVNIVILDNINDYDYLFKYLPDHIYELFKNNIHIKETCIYNSMNHNTITFIDPIKIVNTLQCRNILRSRHIDYLFIDIGKYHNCEMLKDIYYESRLILCNSKINQTIMVSTGLNIKDECYKFILETEMNSATLSDEVYKIFFNEDWNIEELKRYIENNSKNNMLFIKTRLDEYMDDDINSEERILERKRMICFNEKYYNLIYGDHEENNLNK